MTAVRDAATVRVSEPVDGTVKRRSPEPRRVLAGTLAYLRVDPRVMSAAIGARRDGEVVRIVSATEVWLVRKP